MIVVITRTYIFLRAYTPRALAAIGVTVAVAACGGSSTTPPVNTTSVAAGPNPNPGGGVAGALVDAPAGNGGSAPLGHAGQPKLTRVRAHMSVGSSRISHAGGGQITSARSAGSVVNAGPSGSGSGGASSSATTPPKPPTLGPNVPKSIARKAVYPTTMPRPTMPPSTAPPTTVITAPSAPPKTIVHTVYRNVYRTKLKTVTRVRTVTKTLRPDVPTAAFLPSRHPALALTSFTVPGSNVGCQIGPGGVRCSIQRRVWAAPTQPTKCRTTWGNTVSLRPQGPAKFVCGGSSGLSPDAKVIPDGWDDKFGRVTCQVRGIGVDCFSKTHHGFIISRTGYAVY